MWCEWWRGITTSTLRCPVTAPADITFKKKKNYIKHKNFLIDHFSTLRLAHDYAWNLCVCVCTVSKCHMGPCGSSCYYSNTNHYQSCWPIRREHYRAMRFNKINLEKIRLLLFLSCLLNSYLQKSLHDRWCFDLKWFCNLFSVNKKIIH